MPKRTERPRVMNAAPIITTNAAGRPVYYVKRPFLYDAYGRTCQTPLELGVNLAQALSQRDKEAVAGHCYAALAFVHDGAIPDDWLGEWKHYSPPPLAI